MKLDAEIAAPARKERNLDDSDDEEPAPQPKQEQAKVVNPNLRYYDISITFDTYHHTPRLWLSGVKDDGTPLKNEEIYEDVMSDYVDKTVTMEVHPHLKMKQASVHPCKHAEVIHKLVTEGLSNGVEIHPDQALTIFLKFMNSVLPTLEFDYSTEISLKN